MVGLDRQHARGRGQEGLVADQRRGALERGDPDIFEDECALQEVVLIGVDVERLPGLDEPGGYRDGGEALLDVDGRPGHRRAAQRAVQEPDVVELVVGDLGGELADGSGLEGDRAAAYHGAALACSVGQAGGQPVPVHREGVKLSLQVLQVQCEIQDRAIGNRVGVLR